MVKHKVIPFFTDEEAQAVSVNASKDAPCIECGLYKNCISPKMPVTGQGKREVLIIAEAPGETEDEKNIQLVGKAGQYLRDRLSERGYDLDEDFWKTNAIICRPPKNRKPKRKELKCCKPNYMQLIEELQPKFIWLVGAAAIESYYMDRFTDEDGTVLTPTRWRALCIPDSISKAWVIPLFHPSFAMRNEKDDLLQSQYARDLDFALKCLKKRPPKFANDIPNHVQLLKDFDDACNILDGIIKNPPEFLSFDYETTGLKPFNQGHKIACVSFCTGEYTYSFPLEYPHFTTKQVDTLKKKWGEILREDSYKIAHNLKFEDVWSRTIIKVLPNNWHWCTMIGSHILDNRKSFTSLKFQAFIRWGVEQYDKTVAPFLKDKTGSGFNTVMKADLDDMLLYNGIDSLLTMRLYQEQYQEMTASMLNANDLFVDGMIALSDVQTNGICTDRKYYEDTDKKLKKQIEKLEAELLTSKEVQTFKKVRGRDINFASDPDMRDLFFNILKYKPSKMTDTDLPSVDAESIRALGSPLAEKLVELSKLEKIKSTYIGQFLREINDDGRMHPFFNLHLVQTYRSSSEKPNFQNVPTRDEVAKKFTRSGIYPSPGNLILDFDYGALEVRIIGACSHDKKLVAYINDPSTDMHRDKAMEIFGLDQKQVTKMIRFYAKNMFVFAMFYGSWYRACAEILWDMLHKENLKTTDGTDLLDHLVKVGIIKNRNHLGISAVNPKEDTGFAGHLRSVEKKFWKDFEGVKQWQESNWAFYKKHGYVELATGFRCSGYMKRNEIANYPIQGPAFHCLLYSLININDELKRRKMGTKIIGQIHDCCIFDCVPSEKKIVKELSTEIATKKIREDWKWLNVPLILEWEEGGIDKSWFDKKEVREE